MGGNQADARRRGLPARHRSRFVLGVAPAKRQIERVRDMHRRLREGSEALGLVARRRDVGLARAGERELDAVGAKIEGVDARTAVVIIEAADDPVDRAAEGQGPARIGCEADFLGELLAPLVAHLLDDIERGVVEIAVVDRPVVAIGGNRGERAEAEIPFDLAAESLDIAIEQIVAVGALGVAAGRLDRDHAGAGEEDRVRIDDRAFALAREGVAIVAQQLADQADAKVRARLEIETKPPAIIVDALGMVAGLRVLHIAFGEGPPTGDAALDRVAEERSRDRGEDIIGVELAKARLGFGREAVGRPLGDDVDRAADGVAAIECALRPLQHLDALDIAERAERARGASEIDFVDEHADRRLGARVELAAADAADIELRPGRSEEHTSELQSLMRNSYAVFCLKKKTKKSKTETTKK